MKIGTIIQGNQEEVYYKLNKKRKRKRRRKRKSKKENLSLSDVETLMRHDSYERAHGGALRQKTWSK